MGAQSPYHRDHHIGVFEHKRISGATLATSDILWRDGLRYPGMATGHTVRIIRRGPFGEKFAHPSRGCTSVCADCELSLWVCVLLDSHGLAPLVFGCGKDEILQAEGTAGGRLEFDNLGRGWFQASEKVGLDTVRKEA